MIATIKDTLRNHLRAWQLARPGDGWIGTRCYTGELFARQNRASGYMRADLFVIYRAIQEGEGTRTGGLAMLQKLIRAEPATRHGERALLGVLRRSPLSESLFIADDPVVDAELNLLEKPTALAMAIHRRQASVGITVKTSLKGRIPSRRYDLEWLSRNGFTEGEIAMVEESRADVFRALGLLPLPWETLIGIRKEMRALLPQGVTLHGRGDLYQTCEDLLVPGQRPTAARIREYDLASFLKPSHAVLDIGCNCGFLALQISRSVRMVDGFDVAAHFIAIAEIARKQLARENCRFSVCDFEAFSATEPYDVIFSFAVHHWIGMPIPEYAAKLLQLLRPGGLVLLESQDLMTHDQDWDSKLQQFCGAGFEEVRSGTLCDDGRLARRHVLLRDTRAPVTA